MQVDTELIYLSGIIFAAMLTAMVVLVRTISKSSETNAAINGAMITQSETLVAFNNEIQDHSKERQAWQLERVKFEAEIRSYKNSAIQEAERFDRQFKGLMSQIAQVRTQRDRLQGEFEAMKRRIDQLEAENKNLQGKVTALELENKELRGDRMVLIDKVDSLVMRLEREIASNNDLRCELDKLQEKMQDLPTTDELSQSAAKVESAETGLGPYKAGQPVEPGENKAPEENEMSEETTNDGPK